MKKLVWVLVAALTIIFTPNNIVRANPNQRGILIAEVQTGSAASASDEFVELYNASDHLINLSSYRLEYFPASASDFVTPTRSVAMSGVIAPNGRYLLSSTDYLSGANASFGATLAKTGGHLRVVNFQNLGVVVDDVIGWGSAKLPEVSAAAAPDGGKSIVRRVVENDIQDTNNNSEDFEISDVPTPQSMGVSVAPIEPEDPEIPENPQPEEPPEEPEVPEESEEPFPESPEPEVPESPSTQVVLPIHITELLPNPGSPKTDTNDEFIELYNPNSDPVDLEGFHLDTGNEFSYSFVFGSRVIGPQQYMVLMASETNLTLANSGGKARLVHANGTVLSETLDYDEAKDDMAWALVGTSWQWTTTSTPGQPNLITAESKNVSVVSKLKKATTTKPKAAKTSSAKTASAKNAKVASAKAAGKENEDTQDSEEKKKLPLQPVILAGVGTLALGYAAYEYRSDIANQIRKLRGFRKNRSHSGE